MGLKGYRLWVNLIQPAEPHLGDAAAAPGVALQVAFERRIFKPVFSLDRL
jgi:hypothetical protein